MFTELDNQMIVTLDGTEAQFDTNFQSRNNRRIELDHYIGENSKGEHVWLRISTTHRDKGAYRVLISRHIQKNGFIEFRVIKDQYGSYLEGRGARYSDKNLEAVALDAINRQANNLDELRNVLDWAKELMS